MSTIRDALYEILGEKCALGIIHDASFEWCIATAVAMIETKGGPQTQLQRGFLKWVRDDWPDIEVEQPAHAVSVDKPAGSSQEQSGES